MNFFLKRFDINADFIGEILEYADESLALKSAGDFVNDTSDCEFVLVYVGEDIDHVELYCRIERNKNTISIADTRHKVDLKFSNIHVEPLEGLLANIDNRWIIKKGSRLIGEARFYYEENLLPIQGFYSLPVKSKDGKEAIYFIDFRNSPGVTTADLLFDESGIWEINEELINRGSPMEQYIRCETIRIDVIK